MDMQVYWGAENNIRSLRTQGDMASSHEKLEGRSDFPRHSNVAPCCTVGTTVDDIRYQNTLVYARKPFGRTRPRANDSVRPPD
eukprot:COSAG02_NODE_2006_length_10124_cov_6.398664_3_plen_83_part_00